MAWITAGSLTATSGNAAIVGTGTSFLSAMAGDMLVHSSGVYEILSVTDNTHLTLARNWAGSTGAVANGSWQIAPVSTLRSSVATVASSIAALIAAYQNLVVATGASTTITLNKSAAGNNNGLILQDNLTAVAHIGTFGNDNIKIQPTWDGSTYVNGITITRSAGADNGQVSVGVGSAGAPALVFNGDSNTGLFGGTDIIAIATAGVERLRVTSAGYVGLGTASPNSPLHVAGGLTDPAAALSSISVGYALTVTADNAQQINQISINNSNYVVPAGVTISGGYSGLRIDGFVNTTLFAGTMTTQLGVWSRAGVLLAAATGTPTVSTAEAYRAELRADIANATITSLYAFRCSYGTIAGTVTSLYGLFLPAVTITGTVTNYWGVYSADASARNYFAGKVGIGYSTPAYALHAIDSGGIQIVLGSSVTNSTAKSARIAYEHYTAAEEKCALLFGSSDGVNNVLSVGGGTSVLNAATQVDFYTAANNTTVTGTLAGRFNSSQQLLLADGAVGTPALSFISDANLGIYRAGTDILGWVTAGAERGRVNASGHFLLGTTVDNGVLTVGGNIMPEADNTRDLGSTTFRMHTIYAGTGTINTSDAREKSNIIDIRDGSAIVRAISPKSFDKYGEERLGFLAQDVRKVLAKAGIGRDTVKGDENKENLGIYAEDLIAPLWASQREVLARLDALELRRAA